ncbi:MAG TPA: D-hexose-6-phosphate mutarotase, partial [Armatimonadota bacterium]|nr:D-hexose-6-phosphate mutarotase [Armatimonadota bacterium]
KQGADRFFVSKLSHFTPSEAIRGGIPIIFPQFGPGPLPKHGFARVSEWELLQTARRENGDVSAVLQLQDSPATLAVWPYRFQLQLQVLLQDDALTLVLQVKNNDTREFPFHAVFHTYLRVADIRRVAVSGLQGVTYIDSLREDKREKEEHAEIRFAQEVDRIYVQTPDQVWLVDEETGRSILIEKENMPDVTVWNPWVEKSKRLTDFGDEEYQRMVCVETGIMDTMRVLRPGEVWQGKTRFTCRQS